MRIPPCDIGRSPPDIAVAGNQLKPNDASTAAIGRIAYETVAGETPEPETKKALSAGVHWGNGCAQGAIYGAFRSEDAGPPDALGGLVLGTTLWGVSELALPILGLGKGPTAWAPEEHLSTWGAHLVYGIVVSTVTQVLRKLVQVRPRWDQPSPGGRGEGISFRFSDLPIP